MLAKLIKLFFPRLCYSCGEVGTYLCDFCEQKEVQYLNLQYCHVCKKEMFLRGLVHTKCKAETNLDGVVVALKYNKFIEKLIAEFKYEFITDLKVLLSRYLAVSFRKFIKEIKKGFVVTYVPLHKKKKLWRGYNQTEVLANFIALNSGLEVQSLLVKTEKTKSQVGLSKFQRSINVKGSFATVLEDVPQCVVVIDDVMTTGATLEECAGILKESGVEEVYGLVIARG